MNELDEKGRLAQEAARMLPGLMLRIDDVLIKAAAALESNAGYILEENKKDLGKADISGMNGVLLDRLTLNPERIKQMADGIRQVAALPSPLGKVLYSSARPNGLLVERVSTPLGVIGIIYEARPNVTADAAALCVKAGNAVILRGGKEAIHSNKAITKTMINAVMETGLPEGCIQLIENTSRESALGLMRLNQYLDVIIPRGGSGLISAVMENATVPAIETGIGNCHIYVDETADLKMAEEITVSAKISRPGICNAAEKLLAHKGIAADFLPSVLHALDNKGVEVKGDETVRRLYPKAAPMTEADWYLEFLDMVIGVKVVEDIDDAIRHINKYSSKHSEAIITGDEARAAQFLNEVDSAAVYVNASTRFTDGFEFGLGAEIGISTQKVHARGPMGLEALTASKFIIRGNGQTR